MRRTLSAILGSIFLSLGAAMAGQANNTREFSVEVSAQVQTSPARITLHWLQDTAVVPASYTVYRRAPGESSWGNGITLPGAATHYTDEHVALGTPYEYQIVRKSSACTGYGYIYAGIQVPYTENRGKLLLVVDRTYARQLTNELARLQQDLAGDGWTVCRLDVNRSDSAPHVKDRIRAQYEADPAKVRAVFLFGHVPVPYSGDIGPDGHFPDHEGAWPCDGYYGDMNGVWTDDTVNDTRAAEPRNRNVPGDGKFDQSVFPAPLKLMVGRVDLANMPGRTSFGGPATFPSELELLRNYLNKDHNFRHKLLNPPERGIVGDYFGARGGEAFAASGWRNFTPFFGAANVTALPRQGTWISTLSTNAYLWAYGCGSGSYTSIGGLGHVGQYDDGVTTELVQGNIKAVFTLLYGSWLGDWDSEDNLQRAVLATRDYGLTCAWSGRPHWFLHHMALGEPIGLSTLITQNDGFTHLYQNQENNCAGWTHIALMGDPTLRMQFVSPPSGLNAVQNSGSVALNWTASRDAVVGYNIYRATNSAGPFTRVNSSLVSGTAFIDSGAPQGSIYMVRAVKLENSASGTYWNPSEGIQATPVEGAQNIATTSVKPSAAGTNAAPVVASNRLSPTGTTTGTGANDTVWFDDSLPQGAITGADGGDGWNWISSNPTPYSGAVAHQSNIASGFHQHYFDWAYWGMLTVNTGEVLFAYVYLDPNNVPAEVMLNWNDGTWEHRAYWGANDLNFGTDGTPSRQYVGPLPSAGQWVRLEVPASQVALEGSSLKGMAFSLYGGQATWDYAGKSTAATVAPPSTPTNLPPTGTSAGSSSGTTSVSTANSIPGVTAADDIALQMPAVGANALHVLSPTLLELKLINTKAVDPAQVAQWNLVANNLLATPSTGAFAVTANGQTLPVQSVGFKRRPLYAPLVQYDLRIENSLYLQLASPIADNQTVQVQNTDGTLWGTNLQFIAKVDPLRFNPALHVNQEGYLPNYSKKAMVGYYLGSLGEMNVPASAGFTLVDAATGAAVYQGSLVQRPDVGWLYTPAPYQQVYEADFTAFNTPGQYRLVVPGMGASLPFSISGNVAMSFARAYALGLYHQRCGTSNTLPFTRFTHDACHTAPAAIPSSAAAFPFTWTTISNYSQITNPDNPVQTAPKLTGPAAQLFPFVNQGSVDVSGGHHDAGDYSKYTENSAALIHYLIFAVDSIPGVADLDNLGIPESGDGISDVLQEAKWESDFLAKMQDADGGFYFLVYPQTREYENNVLPDHGDPQLVWPKTSSVTAASVAALAECASSPAFKKAYPAAAALYLQKALLGWQFLTNAIAKYGKNGIYQKITHYGDDFADQDELAWAACEMYLATGDPQYQQTLFQWFPDPTDPATFRWSWWRMYLYYGNAVRSYAFAARSGRLSASQLDPNYLAKCVTTITNAANDLVTWSQESAYGTSFPEATKHVLGAGWYFSGDQTYDLTVAYQLNPQPNYLAAIAANMNYEGGCNPVNVCYVTGLGWKRPRDVVSQYDSNDRRILPQTGFPVGNVQNGFSYLGNYQSELGELCFPSDGAATAPYPFYDRWGDSWNVSTESVSFEQARSLATYAFLAGQTSLKTQAWKPVPAQIIVPTNTAAVGVPLTVSLQAPGLDLSTARIVWEARDQDPFMGQTFTFSPKNNGNQWVEAEAQLPDGRRVFAEADFNADSPNIVWVDDALPAGAVPGTDGGDAWTWATGNPTPVSGTLDQQSTIAPGEHQHFFDWATATLTVNTGTVLYAYVYLDPANPPAEVMLEWNNGDWNHIAYWGADNIGFGTDGTASRRYMGALPALGQWVQLKVPASQVGLEGSTVKGMGFCIYNGRAWWDAAGLLNPNVSTNSNTGTGTTNPAAQVTVTATDASRVGPTPGTFTFTRSGDTSTPLSINYSLSGTALSGTDYQLPPSTNTSLAGSTPGVVIPAGASSATLAVTPVATTNAASIQTVVLTVGSAANYVLGSPSNATMVISGNVVRLPAIQMNTAGPMLSWASNPNAGYRVAYKTNLSQSTWTYFPSGVPAGGGTNTSWVDTSATNQPQRFYLIIQTQ